MAMANRESEDESKPLMKPIQIGLRRLQHRVVLAPMTRCRARDTLATDMMKEYYTQRATDGGLLISEGVCVAPNGHGFVNTAGIYTPSQVASWQPITQSVHAAGATFFLQLWHVGRASHTALQPNNGAPVSSTATPVPLPWRATLVDADGQSKHNFSPPRALELAEIPEVVEWFRVGARNALQAGFDGCEVHGAHGYLLDSFVKESINDRTDAYGGSLPNRCRLLIEVTKAVIDEIGAQRTAVRISPFSIYNAAASDSDPAVLLQHLLGALSPLNLAYIHLTEPEFTFIMDDFTWSPTYAHLTRERGTTPLLVSGGHDWASGNHAVGSGYADLVGFGRAFIANPDLVSRLRGGHPLTPPVPATFYGDYSRRGYTDYPFLEPQLHGEHPPP